MIWFAGRLQNTCCNKGKKNKTNIKHWVVSVMSLNYAHWVTFECRNSVFAMKTQTNSFNFSCVGNQSVYLFLDSSATFFKGDGRTCFGRALSRWLFFQPLYCVLDAFLKKRMALPIWKSYVRCWRKDRNFNIKFNVTELYVIKSWWKIKFNKRKVYHQLVCLFVFLFFFC